MCLRCRQWSYELEMKFNFSLAARLRWAELERTAPAVENSLRRCTRSISLSFLPPTVHELNIVPLLGPLTFEENFS